MLTGEFHQYSRINSRSMKFHFVSSNLKDFLISISFRFFEYPNFPIFKKEFEYRNHNTIRYNNSFKKKYHSRNKCSIIDSPIFSIYSMTLQTMCSSIKATRCDSRTYFFSQSTISSSKRCGKGDNVNNDLALLVFRCFCERETRNRSVTKVDRDDQRLSSRPIDYRN